MHKRRESPSIVRQSEVIQNGSANRRATIVVPDDFDFNIMHSCYCGVEQTLPSHQTMNSPRIEEMMVTQDNNTSKNPRTPNSNKSILEANKKTNIDNMVNQKDNTSKNPRTPNSEKSVMEADKDDDIEENIALIKRKIKSIEDEIIKTCSDQNQALENKKKSIKLLENSLQITKKEKKEKREELKKLFEEMSTKNSRVQSNYNTLWSAVNKLNQENKNGLKEIESLKDDTCKKCKEYETSFKYVHLRRLYNQRTNDLQRSTEKNESLKGFIKTQEKTNMPLAAAKKALEEHIQKSAIDVSLPHVRIEVEKEIEELVKNTIKSAEEELQSV